MLKTASRSVSVRQNHVSADVEITGLALAVPTHCVTQAEVTARARQLFPKLGRHDGLFANTGIESRYTCQPPEWYHQNHGWEERTEVFRRHALDLLERVAVAAIADASLTLDDIDAIVVNTITGLAIPSLDAMLMNRLQLKPTIERLPIFGLGCGGGVAGLARAARMAQALPGRNVLFLTVDLCSLCFRATDDSMAMFVATALFGDGAAAAVLRSGHGKGPGASGPRVAAMGEHFWRGTERIMGWDVKEDGFGVVLSPELPALIETKLAPALQEFLDANAMSLGELAGFALHPGGGKVLQTIEKVLGLSRADLVHSWDVLRKFGNMSSPTALFALDRAIKSNAGGPHLLAAFGPGFSAYFAIVELQSTA
jgi:alkylresorcinol/alkylpyrone synthase